MEVSWSGLPLDVKELARRGQAVYEQELRALTESQYYGRFLAVEPDSKEFWIADTVEEACRLARAALPGKFFHLVRVGFPAAHLARCLRK